MDITADLKGECRVEVREAGMSTFSIVGKDRWFKVVGQQKER